MIVKAEKKRGPSVLLVYLSFLLSHPPSDPALFKSSLDFSASWEVSQKNL